MKNTRIRKRTALILITLMAALMFDCSGGGGLSSSGNTSAVTIAVSGLRKAARSAASVPGSVTQIKIMISAPDMQTIERTVDVSGRDTVSESFDVPIGGNRHFLAVAYSADGSSSLYQGDLFSDLNGTPRNIDILMGFDISGQWTITSSGPNGTTGPTTILTVTQTGNSLTLSGTISDGGSFVGGGTVIGKNYQSTATGNACGNTFNRSVTGTVSADGHSMSGNFALSGGCPTYSSSGSWSAAKTTQPTPTPTPTPIPTPTPSPTPTPTPTPLPSGFPTNIPTGNYGVSIQVCISGTCYSGTTFTVINTDINQFAQSLLNALNAAGQSHNNGCDQTAGCTCAAPVISYTPWDGASFRITYDISETCGGQTTSASIQFVVSKM